MDKTYICETRVAQFLVVYYFIKLYKRTQKTSVTLHFSHQTELPKMGRSKSQWIGTIYCRWIIQGFVEAGGV